jgi:hypothetical protein
MRYAKTFTGEKRRTLKMIESAAFFFEKITWKLNLHVGYPTLSDE